MVDAQSVFVATVPTLTILIAILVINSRLSDLRAHLDSRFNAVDQRFSAVDRRFTDMEAVLTEKLLRVEQVLDARLKHLEEACSRHEGQFVQSNRVGAPL